MQYTETQLTQLIADVEKEFNSHLAKAEDAGTTLAKSEDGDKKPEKKPEEEKAPEAKPEADAKAAAPEEKAPEAEAKPAEAAPAAPPVAAPAAEAAPAHDYDAEDLAHLEKMYMSMSEGERKVHHDAIMKCAGMAKCGDMNGAAPQGDAGQSADSHSHPDVQKSELNAHSENAPAPKVKGSEVAKEYEEANGGKIDAQAPANSPGAKSPASKADGVQMEKSEQGTESELMKAELGAKTAELEALKKNFDAVQAFLTKLVEKKPAPAAKAITSLEVIAKSEGSVEEKPLNKSEIDSKLLAKSQDPKTSKSDRDAINAFYLDNQDIKGISHLLK